VGPAFSNAVAVGTWHDRSWDEIGGADFFLTATLLCEPHRRTSNFLIYTVRGGRQLAVKALLSAAAGRPADRSWMERFSKSAHINALPVLGAKCLGSQ
jgi:hypothetical protein